MKSAWLLVLLLIAGLLLGPLWSGNTGYVLISIGQWTIETSLVAGLLIAVIVILVVRTLWRLLVNLVQRTKWGIRWFGERRSQKAAKAYTEGAQALVNGDPRSASKAFNRSWQLQRSNDTALMACYAALQINDVAQARAWLGHVTTRAQLHLAETLMTLNSEPEQAHRIVDELPALLNKHPHHPALLRTALSTYVRMQRWQAVIDLLPAMQKLNLLSDTEWLDATENAYRERFLEQGRMGAKALQEYWQKLSREQRRTAPIRRAYLHALIQFNQMAAADKVAARGLKRGELKLAQLLDQQLIVAGTELRDYVQDALKRQPDDAMLLQALGQMAVAAKDWSLAQRALRRAAELAPSKRVWLDLATVYENQGDSQGAVDAYKKALRR